ncbi:MAG: hypothetical protein IPN47_10430 [Gemmatimonadetes bacterium]|nr:hypothetical protein [Gemmatimonadota bacterium]
MRAGDQVEFHLSNHPYSSMPHNIDLHAVTGPGGGASSFTAPGHESQFTFKALNQGLYVYHCATAPVGMHIANGMYGLILVEPAEGMPKVDREFYVMQGDFYTEGGMAETGLQPFDMQQAMREEPEYVVFNGSVGALTGDNALKAKVGETVRIYMGNGGPNLVSSFPRDRRDLRQGLRRGRHLANPNVQTTLIPPAGRRSSSSRSMSAGTFILVDHSIFRAFNKGALGMLEGRGAGTRRLYSGKQDDLVYLPEGGARSRRRRRGRAPARRRTHAAGASRAASAVFAADCAACHQLGGKGSRGVPAARQIDYLMADRRVRSASSWAVWLQGHGERSAVQRRDAGADPRQRGRRDRVVVRADGLRQPRHGPRVVAHVRRVRAARPRNPDGSAACGWSRPCACLLSRSCSLHVRRRLARRRGRPPFTATAR